MTSIVIGMVLIILVALVVLSVFSEDDEDWSSRAGGEPTEAHLDELLGSDSGSEVGLTPL